MKIKNCKTDKKHPATGGTLTPCSAQLLSKQRWQMANPPENHSERARTSTGVQVSNFYKSSTVIFRNFWLYLSPYTTPCKYSVCKSGQLHDCKIQSRSTKNWASQISSLGYLWWTKHELHSVWFSFIGSLQVFWELWGKGIYSYVLIQQQQYKSII